MEILYIRQLTRVYADYKDNFSNYGYSSYAPVNLV